MTKRFFIVSFLFLSLSNAYAFIGNIDVNAGPPPDTTPLNNDRSALWMRSGTRITLMIVDEQSHRTGVDPTTYEVKKTIPNSACDVDFIANKYTGEEHAEADERITFDPAKKGTYRLLIHGLQAGPFEISVSAQSQNGSSEPSKEIEGIVSEGEDKTLVLTYDPAINATLSVVDTSH